MFRTFVNISRTVIIVLRNYRPTLLRALEAEYITLTGSNNNLIYNTIHVIKNIYNHRVYFPGSPNNEHGYRVGNLVIGLGTVGAGVYSGVKLNQANGLLKESLIEQRKQNYHQAIANQIASDGNQELKRSTDELKRSNDELKRSNDLKEAELELTSKSITLEEFVEKLKKLKNKDKE